MVAMKAGFRWAFQIKGRTDDRLTFDLQVLLKSFLKLGANFLNDNRPNGNDTSSHCATGWHGIVHVLLINHYNEGRQDFVKAVTT